MQVSWVRYGNGEWCNLETLNLEQPHFEEMQGVYIIWKGEVNRQVIYVGRGIIKDRLYSHRNDPRITRLGTSKLYVTWASVHYGYQQGVEYFLASALAPEVGEHYLIKPPIPVNLPF